MFDFFKLARLIKLKLHRVNYLTVALQHYYIHEYFTESVLFISYSNKNDKLEDLLEAHVLIEQIVLKFANLSRNFESTFWLSFYSYRSH